MGGFPPKKSVPKDRFSQHMSLQKTQVYPDHSGGRGAGSNIRTLAWAKTGTRIATGAGDRTVRVWNPDRPQTKYSTELRGHNGAVSYVVWNPKNDNELASCSSDGTVRLWDVRAKTSRSEIKTGNEPFTMAWRPDGRVLMVGRKDDALLPIHFPPDGGDPVAQKPLPQPVQTNQTIFSHAGEHLLLSTGTGGVNLLSYPDMKLVHTFNGHTSSCLCVALDPTAKWIAIGGSDALISTWDALDGFPRPGLDEMVGPVRSVGFSFDGAYVCGGSDEGTGIKIAHVQTSEYVHTIPTAHPAASVAWHPQRYWIAYSGDPQGLKIAGAAP